MRSTTFFRQYLSVLKKRDIDLTAFLQEQGIDADFLSDPNGRLEHDHHDRIWQQLLSYNSESITLNNNESLQPESLSPVVLVAMSCTDLLEALEALIQLKNIESSIRFQLLKQGDTVVLQASEDIHSLKYSAHYLSLTLQHLLDLIFWLTGTQVLPQRIITPEPLTGLFEYERQLSDIIEQQAQPSQVIFSAAALNIPLRISNPLIRQVLEQQAHEALSKYSHSGSFRNAVASHIKTYLEQHQQLPEAELSAKFLCMTTRTLQRKLKQEDTRYREIGDKVRLEKIEQLLRQGADTQRILYQCGLADSRALKNLITRVSGKSWDEYRQLLK